MSLKSAVAVGIGKSSYWFLHNFLHGGSSLPGKLTTKLDPDILKKWNHDYRVIIVTGTNGKTLTTALITKVLEEQHKHVLTNPSGSNMIQGIVTTFLKDHRPRHTKPVAVLEVDEANVVKVTKYIKPIAFVLTNIFRDQIDRYGEIYTTFKKIVNGIKQAPKATIIANGDDPIFNSVKLPNPKIYYGFNYDWYNKDTKRDIEARPNTDDVLCPRCQHILHYHYITYANLGYYFCPNCHFKRPQLDYSVYDIARETPNSSLITLEDTKNHHLDVKIDVGGTYNIYNALTAFAVGSFMGIHLKQIADAFKENQHLFGRQEIFKIGDHQVELILSKNPVGLDQVIDMISHEKDSFSLVWLLNANFADGVDTSWIWDVNFERLNALKVKQCITGGIRHKDASDRLKLANINQSICKDEPDFDNLIDDIKKTPTKKVYVLANYTSMTHFRKLLENGKYVKKVNL